MIVIEIIMMVIVVRRPFSNDDTLTFVLKTLYWLKAIENDSFEDFNQSLSSFD